jgi:hypothetical protein
VSQSEALLRRESGLEEAEPQSKGRSMLRFSQSALIAISVALAATSASFAQTTTKMSPGEMAAFDKVKAEKTAVCRAEAKEQKLSLTKRRAFVKDCVAKALGK